MAEIKSMVRLISDEEELGWAKNAAAASSERRTLEQSRWSARHRAWLVKAPSGRSLPLATLEPERADPRAVPLGHGEKGAGWP